LGVLAVTYPKWETDQHLPTGVARQKVIRFLGYDPFKDSSGS